MVDTALVEMGNLVLGIAMEPGMKMVLDKAIEMGKVMGTKLLRNQVSSNTKVSRLVLVALVVALVAALVVELELEQMERNSSTMEVVVVELEALVDYMEHSSIEMVVDCKLAVVVEELDRIVLVVDCKLVVVVAVEVDLCLVPDSTRTVK